MRSYMLSHSPFPSALAAGLIAGVGYPIVDVLLMARRTGRLPPADSRRTRFA